jgi:hypothetical protein
VNPLVWHIVCWSSLKRLNSAWPDGLTRDTVAAGNERKDERRPKDADLQNQFGSALLSRWTVGEKSEYAAEDQPEYHGVRHRGVDRGTFAGQADASLAFQAQSVPTAIA